MRQFNLDEDVARQAHGTIGGKRTRLAEILEKSRHGNDADDVEWLVPVTPATVHRIESLFRLAADENITFRLKPAAGLSDREAAFLEDFLTFCLPGSGPAWSRVQRKFRDASATLTDCLYALTRTCLLAPSAVRMDDMRVDSAVLIGAYGGEHVGDIAILSGVLQHLHERYGLRRARLCSHRCDHTRRLVSGLATPVELSVHAYEIRQVDRLLDNADALVLAGGPLMDLPRVLVRHLAAACSAQRRERPFIIERIGVGPFRYRASEWAASRIARYADQVSVRTSAAAAHPILDGIKVETSRDAAVDFLAQRQHSSHPQASDRESINEMLRDTEGRLRVAINLRPIGHQWSKNGATFSKMIEDRFVERFAEGLVRFAAKAPRPVTYIFFPMNPIQFGSSDLASAYRLHRLVGSNADLRVWEADPDMEAIFFLLDQSDMAVTMRLHAAIFALSRDIPVLGIDYRPGQGCKVEQMFHDIDRVADVCRMEAFEGDWLVNRLLGFANEITETAGEHTS